MKGYIPVEIPCKRYVKAYIENNHALPLKIDRRNKSIVIEKLFDYIDRNRTSRPVLQNYNSSIKVYLTYDQFNRRGAWLTAANIRNFNAFVESLIKERFRLLMDDAWRVQPGFDCHLPEVLKALNLSTQDWDYETVKKDYYRYRLRNNMQVLQKVNSLRGKIAAVHVPFL